MPHEQTNRHGQADDNDDELPSSVQSRTDRESNGNLDSDNLLDEIDRLIEEAPEWETFVQKGGQ